MRFQFRLPRVFASSVEAGPQRARAVLDGSDVEVPNTWNLPPHTVALVGRPAVWFSFNVSLPRIPFGFAAIPARRLVWEQDFGGHLFLAVTDADPSRVALIEAGPMNADGSGGLVPFAYPEDDFAKRGVLDFEPIPISPPSGLSAEFFAGLVRRTQRGYDGDQRYVAVELPFLRVGRDSNSYAVGVLLCCGVDDRVIPKAHKALRYEWTGYPGAKDPVHRANFGAYLGAPTEIGLGLVEAPYHDADGSVRLVLIGGEPNARVRLGDGSEVTLDEHGRLALAPEDALRRGLPSRRTEPPQQIRDRRRFPKDPAPAGAEITLVVDGRSVPLERGARYKGTVVARHDAVGLAILRTNSGGEVVLPLAELGVELRDPRRVDRLLRVGTSVTVGLHRDRHPKLTAHGGSWLRDRFGPRRLHAPRARNIAGTFAAVAGIAAAAALVRRKFC